MSKEYEVPGFKPGVLVAGADLSTHQFKPVAMGTDGRVVLAVDGALAIGILQNKPLANEACEIEMDGISKAVFGASLSNAGTVLTPAATTGKLVAATSGDFPCAIQLEPGLADGDIAAVKVLPIATPLA